MSARCLPVLSTLSSWNSLLSASDRRDRQRQVRNGYGRMQSRTLEREVVKQNDAEDQGHDKE